MRISRHRLLRSGAVTSLALALAVTTAAPAQAASPGIDAPSSRSETTDDVKSLPGAPKLGAADATLLAEAEVAGTQRVTVMVATDREQTAAVVKSLESVGAWIGTVEDKLGYVRASVPTSKVEKVAQLAKVTAVDLDSTIRLEQPTLEPTSREGAAPPPAPGAGTPEANPYMPTQDTGSIDFRKKNPTYDGRGVTIGIVDSGVDLDHPALQTTSTGERKIVDWVTGTDPVLDGDLSWRAMNTKVNATPTFSADNRTWVAPRGGSFAFNQFSENITLGSQPNGDINRDGDTTDTFGILYDSATNDIWVDADQNGAFTPSELMRPYKEKFQVGHFGTDNPATPIAERTPFVVEFREDLDLSPLGQTGRADFVSIGLVQDSHGSHVAGIAAANNMLGGAMDGQAPGAKIVSSRACTWTGGCTDAALLDGMIDLVTKRGVDVVNMSIGGVPPLNDANNARAVVYDRLIADYGVQLFISGANSGPGLNSIGDPSIVPTVVSVASSISKETWKSNYGAVVSAPQALHTFSSRGPSESGDFKPNISAPGSAVSTVPLWWTAPQIAETGYTLPVGYAMFNGTSMASPQATGAAALLLSGAFQTDLDVTPKRLRDAIYTSATPIAGESVVAQGVGLMNVRGAWDLLGKRAETASYTTDAPVCTAISEFLKTPNRGTGLYNRCAAAAGGQKVGVAKSYDLTVTRTSGDTRASRHTIRIVGNDGTFKAPNSVSLAAGKPATVSVTARATKPGLHAAYLEIDDPKTPVIDHRVNLTVVAADELAAPNFSVSKQGSTERNRSTSYFVTVPEGAKTLQIDLSGIATRSQTRFIAYDPNGSQKESSGTATCFTNFAGGNGCNPLSRAYVNPQPGTWEIIVESRRTTPVLVNPHQITASVLSVGFEPEVIETTTEPDGSVKPVNFTVKNQFGPITLIPRPFRELASRFDRVPTLKDGERKTFTVDVPANTSVLLASIGKPSDADADVDMVILGPNGDKVGQSVGAGSSEISLVQNPEPGQYTIAINGFSVPSGSTTIELTELIQSSSLGSVEVAQSPLNLGPNSTATVTATMKPAVPITGGRTLVGAVDLFSTGGAEIASGTIRVRESAPAVTPSAPAVTPSAQP